MPWQWESFLPRGKADKPENYITYKKAGPEAMKVIARYHSKLDGSVKHLAEKAKKLAERYGFVFTFTGRRLRFPRGYKSYKASGLLIQATAADLNKENWIIVDEELDGVGHMIVNTHDDYNLSLPEDWEPHFNGVKARIEAKDRLRVPLILELNGTGANWWQAIQKN